MTAKASCSEYWWRNGWDFLRQLFLMPLSRSPPRAAIGAYLLAKESIAMACHPTNSAKVPTEKAVGSSEIVWAEASVGD